MPDISPLFAVEAERLLSEGKTDDAIELCEKGILVYPKYPVALSILAKAYRIKGELDAANEKLATVEQFRPNYKAVEITKSQIENPDFELQIQSSDSNSVDDTTQDDTTEVIPEEDNLNAEADTDIEDTTDEENIVEEEPSVPEEAEDDGNFEIEPEDIDALFADDSPKEVAEDPIQEEEIISEAESHDEIPELEAEEIDIQDIANDLYEDDTPAEIELSEDIGENLAAELDSLVEVLEEEESEAEELAEEAVAETEEHLAESSNNFNLSSELEDLEDEDELKEAEFVPEISTDEDFDLSSELSSLDDDEDFDVSEKDGSDDFNISAQLGILEHDEDLDEVSDKIDDSEAFEEYKKSDFGEDEVDEIYRNEPIREDKVDTTTQTVDFSKMPKNAKMSALIDDTVATIRARDLSLIAGLKTSPLQAESSVKTRNYSEQLLPASPAFPDSISVNAITSTLGNNWEAKSLDIDENDIDRSGAEDNFSMLADKIKNLSMPKVQEPAIAEEEEDYAPPAVVSPTIANLLAMQGRTNEAIAAYEKLITEDSDNADVYREKIRSLS